VLVPYFEPGRFGWDATKDEQTLEKGKQDGRKPLSELEPLLFVGSESDGFIIEDDRQLYGERRFWLFRVLEERPYRATFTMRRADLDHLWQLDWRDRV
jgi:hypothetical protein